MERDTHTHTRACARRSGRDSCTLREKLIKTLEKQRDDGNSTEPEVVLGTRGRRCKEERRRGERRRKKKGPEPQRRKAGQEVDLDSGP